MQSSDIGIVLNDGPAYRVPAHALSLEQSDSS